MSRALLVLAACASPAPPPATPIGAHVTSTQPAPAGMLRGRVVNRAGHPVANVMVSTDRPPEPQEFVAQTSRTGEFTLRFGEPYLTNGFEVHAWLGDVYAAMPVGVPRGAKDPVTITVLPVGRVRGTITGANKVMFAAQFDDGGYIFAPVAADGTFFVRLPIGHYLVGDADAPSNLEPVDVLQDAEATVTITR